MKFLVDESAGRSVAEFLRAAGHDVVFAGEAFPQTDDSIILANAVREKRVLVTNDKDFGELVYRSGKPHEGVIFLRLRDERSEQRVRMVKYVLDRYAALLQEHFIVATESDVRIRPFPPLS